MAPATSHTPPTSSRARVPNHSCTPPFTRRSLGGAAEWILRRYRDPSAWVGWPLVSDRLVWIDCEMTGLDIVADALIEVAALVTDFDLNVQGQGIDLIIKPPAEALDQMIDFVREMHNTSGLIEELADGTTLEEA